MDNSLAKKILTAVAVGVVCLAHLPPAAFGMLLCVEEAAETDCCPDDLDSPESPVYEAEKVLDSSDCACCIAFDAVPGAAGAGSHKVALDVVSGPAFLGKVVSRTGMAIPSARSRLAGGGHLGSLRTVVLLI